MPFLIMGYKIDTSCDDKGITTDVRNAMTSAFEMVNAAYTTLRKPSLSADELELVGYLFAKEGEDPAQLLREGKMDKTMRVLHDIRGNMEQEVTGSAAVSNLDVVGRHAFFIVDNTDVSIPDHLLPLRPMGTRRRQDRSLGG
jgi:hypothetical protein